MNHAISSGIGDSILLSCQKEIKRWEWRKVKLTMCIRNAKKKVINISVVRELSNFDANWCMYINIFKLVRTIVETFL